MSTVRVFVRLDLQLFLSTPEFADTVHNFAVVIIVCMGMGAMGTIVRAALLKELELLERSAARELK